ncbi:3-hydroxyacyl-CoA dehydrogenase NAD-binding domain-containing protein, partial [Bradyrhizobium sp.]|uniref:3-hydroxyacyl-CoA dehydrogenase NAD-binding domain-containing protein n=1 Tax=Bradyrhizobium sp. TaxID=376 RepID=UPI003C752CE7
MPADPKIAAIVGSGFIGRAWAIAFARAGCSVRLYDAQSTAGPAALAFIDSVLDDLAANDLLLGSTAAEVRTRISTVTDLGQALAGADHVQENTPEDLETKRRIFPELDRLAAKDAIIASSTSALVPSSFMEKVPGRARCIVVHPINPPYLIPAVEIVPSQWTSAETLERTRSFMTAIGQSPMVMNREIDGFIMNRMQGALLEEAFRLVADGVCTVEDVDIGIRDGLALRWSF